MSVSFGLDSVYSRYLDKRFDKWRKIYKIKYMRRYFPILLIVFSISFACTIGVATSTATGGAPILWKNRDVPNWVQQYIYVRTPARSFVAVTYQSEPNRAYAGINSDGFGIVNTDTYNQGAYGVGLNDGEFMYMALSRCQTVWGFLSLLDSVLSDTVFAKTHCYAVIDRYGNALVVECTRTSYTYFNVYDDPQGFMIRANFAESGLDSNLVGYERTVRVRMLAESMLPLDYNDFIEISRDLVIPELDPNPLPFEGIFGSLPYGYIATERTINRWYTTSYQIIVGANDGPGPMMWASFGQPYLTIPFPLWVSADTIPSAVTASSPLCNDARFFTTQTYDLSGHPSWMNTFTAANIEQFLSPYKESIFDEISTRITNLTSTGKCTPDSIFSIENDAVTKISSAYAELRSLLVREHNDYLPENVSISTFPNPFNSVVNIVVQLSFPASVSIYDASGHLIHRIADDIPPGKHSFQWSPQGLPSGLYFVYATSDDATAVAKLIYVR